MEEIEEQSKVERNLDNPNEMQPQSAPHVDDATQIEPIEPDAIETSAKPKQENGVARILYPMLIAFAVLFVFGFFFGRIIFFPIKVQGASMQPTLNANYVFKNGKHLNCDVVYLGSARNATRGDIVAFDSGVVKDGESQNYIKRIIGVPGDTIQFKVSKIEGDYLFYDLYLNGAKQTESYTKGEMKVYAFSAEEYDFIQTFLKDQKKLVLGEDEFFVMGDNRNNSVDSRLIGVVKRSQFIGKVYLHVQSGQSIIQAIIKKYF